VKTIDGVSLTTVTHEIDGMLAQAEKYKVETETRRIRVKHARHGSGGGDGTQEQVWTVELVCYYFHSEDGEETLPEMYQGREHPKVYVCWQDLILIKHPRDTLDFLRQKRANKKLPKRCFDRVVAILFVSGGKDEHGVHLFEPDPHKLKIHDDDRCWTYLFDFLNQNQLPF
jgi:hypothetical protein